MAKFFVGILLLLMMTGVSYSEPEDTPVTLIIHPNLQYSPGTVLYHIRVAPHRDNFWVCFGWENTTTKKFRKSCQQLNGIYSPRYFQQEYRWLDPGHYVGFVHVFRTPNYLAGITTQQFIVLD